MTLLDSREPGIDAQSREALLQARLLVARGELEAALERLDVLLDDAMARPQALLLKAGVLMERRERDEALRVYRSAVREAPRSCAALDGLARCLHALGRNDEALEVAREARGLLAEADNFRHGASVSLSLVWCLREKRELREALVVAEEGLRRWPDAVLAHWASQLEEELAEAEAERC